MDNNFFRTTPATLGLLIRSTIRGSVEVTVKVTRLTTTTAPLPAPGHCLAATKRTVQRDTVASTPLELWSTGFDDRTVLNVNSVIRNDFFPESLLPNCISGWSALSSCPCNKQIQLILRGNSLWILCKEVIKLTRNETTSWWTRSWLTRSWRWSSPGCSPPRSRPSTVWKTSSC